MDILSRLWHRKWLVLNALLIVFLLSMVSIQVVDKDDAVDRSVKIGIGNEKVITLGHAAYAAGSVDYTYDGTDDDVQYQAALNALPATGGRLVDVSAVQKNFSATVTRAIPNVTIIGSGSGSYFTNDGGTALFTAGGNNWVFQDLRTDAGSISMGATTGWSWTNVTVDTQLYTYYAPTTGLGSVYDLNATILDAPVGRVATYVIAASDAPTTVKEQADIVCDGTDDQDDIRSVIDTGVSIYLTEGTFNVGGFYPDTINFYGKNDVFLSGAGVGVTTLIASSDNMSEVFRVSHSSNITIQNMSIEVLDGIEVNALAVCPGVGETASHVYYRNIHVNKANTAMIIQQAGTSYDILFERIVATNSVRQGAWFWAGAGDWVTTDPDGCWDVTVRDCSIDTVVGNGAESSYGAGFYAQCGKHLKIYNLNVRNVSKNGIRIAGKDASNPLEDVIISGGHIEDCGTANVTGYTAAVEFLSYVVDFDVSKLNITDTRTGAARTTITGISVTAGTNINGSVNHNVVENIRGDGIYNLGLYTDLSYNKVGLCAGDGIDDRASYNSVDHNNGYSNDACNFYFIGTHKTVASNSSYDAGTNGMQSVSGNILTFIGNDIDLSGWDGYNFTNASNINVTGGYVGNSNQTNNSRSNVYISGGNYHLIQGVEIRRGVNANKPLFGIYVWSASGYTSLINNDVRDGGTTANISNLSPTGYTNGNLGYIARGETRTYSGTIATLTENAFNSLDNPFGQSVAAVKLDIYVSTNATATAPNIDCGIGASATADYVTMFDDLPGETIGFYTSTITTPGAQTVPILWQTGAGNRYLNMSIKDAAATGMVAVYTITVMGY